MAETPKLFMSETTREPTKATPEKLDEFLSALAETANVSAAALQVGINRQYLYHLRDNDLVFQGRWEAAVKLGTAALEDEAARRAKDGWDEPVFYQGEQCGLVRKFSDTLLIFLLKARDPKYRERLALSTPPGEPLQFQHVDALTDAELALIASRGRATPAEPQTSED
jgi:hypothetical protein